LKVRHYNHANPQLIDGIKPVFCTFSAYYAMKNIAKLKDPNELYSKAFDFCGTLRQTSLLK
jgi:hypothetical protein